MVGRSVGERVGEGLEDTDAGVAFGRSDGGDIGWLEGIAFGVVVGNGVGVLVGNWEGVLVGWAVGDPVDVAVVCVTGVIVGVTDG